MLATRSERYLLDAWSSHTGQAVQLHLSGELDLATKPFLEKLLSRVEGNGNAEIVVDLSNVTFMSVSTLRSFTRAADRASRSGRTFALVMAPSVVRRVLEITGTLDLLGPGLPLSVSESDDSRIFAQSTSVTLR